MPVGSFTTGSDCFRLMIPTANSLDTCKVRKDVGPDLDLNRLALITNDYFEQVSIYKSKDYKIHRSM